MKDEILKEWKLWTQFIQQWEREIDKIKDKDQDGKVSFWDYNKDYAVPYVVDIRGEDIWLKFMLFGKEYSFKTERNDRLLYHLSFKDPGSYPGGRFLSVPKNQSVIDFNYSRNLLCAYSNKYTCGIPPNTHPLPIVAGEKNFKKTSLLENILRKTTAFNIGKDGEDIMINPKNTDRQIRVSQKTELPELLDLIWGEGVERGKKEKRDQVKQFMGTENM